MSLLFSLARPVLMGLDPELAHGATIKALRFLPPLQAAPDDPRLGVEAFGLHFANPIGMAAGFDKHGEVPDQLLQMGFGFTEVGTITPRPQPGNNKPRLFRLPEDQGVINRFGFNSQGHQAVHERLSARAHRAGVVGINVGANKDASDRTADYVAGVRAFADLATYFTINISSPNTPGLRDLQHAAALDDLLARVLDARDELSLQFGRKPVLLKIAPDLSPEDLDDLVTVVRQRKIDGMIISNTTISRPAHLRSVHRDEMGGLSGRPLFHLSTQTLAQVYQRIDRQFPLIGAGGIEDGASARAKMEAGASLLQIYSALVFLGPQLVQDIKQDLVQTLNKTGATSLTTLIGTKSEDWAAGRM